MTAPTTASDVRPSTALNRLTELAAGLIETNADLRDRVVLVMLWPVESRLTISLSPSKASLHDLAEWAQRYGGVILGNTRRRLGSGESYRECSVRFPLHGCTVDVSAHLALDADGARIVADCP